MAGGIIDCRVCPMCKREFAVPMGAQTDYVYKLPRKGGAHDYFCSWTCYRTAKRKVILSKNKMSDEERNWLEWARGK